MTDPEPKPLQDATPVAALPPERLRWHCDPGRLGFASTAELEPLNEIVGQDRALRAIQLGLEIAAPGYNIFVTGFVGTGRNTTIQRLLRAIEPSGQPTPSDWVYVHNFKDPDCPVAIALPPGAGVRLQKAMEEVGSGLQQGISAALDSEAFVARRTALQNEAQRREREVLEQIESAARQAGFALLSLPLGPVMRTELVPVIDGKPVGFGDLELMVQAKRFLA
ncbi:MAG TPA: Lon-like protease helical domain-containing protein, partial [Acidobacteriota bacterium]